MPSFPYVVKGQKFVPSVSLENAVRRMVNQSQVITGGVAKKVGSTTKLTVYNASDVTINEGTAVFFDSFNGSYDSIQCFPITNLYQNYGVLETTLSPGEFGSCIVVGPARVKIYTGSGKYAKPNPNDPESWEVNDNDGFPILFKWSEASQNYALINLSASSGESEAYMGFFKLESLSKTQVRIVYPGSTTYCGKTDVPGADVIPISVIDVPEGSQNIYLCFKYEKYLKYSHWFAAGKNPPDDADIFTMIGTFDNGYIYQALRIGDSILRFGDDWYL